MYQEVKKKFRELHPVEVRNTNLTSSGLDDLKKLFRPKMLSRFLRTKEDDEITTIILSEYFQGDAMDYLSVGVVHRGKVVTKLMPALALSRYDMENIGELDFESAMKELVMEVVPCFADVTAKVADALKKVGFEVLEEAIPRVPQEILEKARKVPTLH